MFHPLIQLETEGDIAGKAHAGNGNAATMGEGRKQIEHASNSRFVALGHFKAEMWIRSPHTQDGVEISAKEKKSGRDVSTTHPS